MYLIEYNFEIVQCRGQNGGGQVGGVERDMCLGKGGGFHHAPRNMEQTEQ